MFEFDNNFSEAYGAAQMMAGFYKTLIQAGMQPSDAARFVDKYFFPKLVVGFEMGDDLFGDSGLF